MLWKTECALIGQFDCTETECHVQWMGVPNGGHPRWSQSQQCLDHLSFDSGQRCSPDNPQTSCWINWYELEPYSRFYSTHNPWAGSLDHAGHWLWPHPPSDWATTHCQLYRHLRHMADCSTLKEREECTWSNFGEPQPLCSDYIWATIAAVHAKEGNWGPLWDCFEWIGRRASP